MTPNHQSSIIKSQRLRIYTLIYTQSHSTKVTTHLIAEQQYYIVANSKTKYIYLKNIFTLYKIYNLT